MFFFRNTSGYELKRAGATFGTGLLSIGLLCVLFGLAVFLAPELLAYIVGSFFIVVGVGFLSTWWGIRK